MKCHQIQGFTSHKSKKFSYKVIFNFSSNKSPDEIAAVLPTINIGKSWQQLCAKTILTLCINTQCTNIIIAIINTHH